jgi:predicted metal-dependent hydrolase
LQHNPDFHRGLDLFNRAHFFDSHEALEDVWRAVPQDDRLRRHLQGMVQLAVAFHHQSTGNYVGAGSVLERALRNLRGAERSFPALDLDLLRAEVAPWREFLDGCLTAEPKNPTGQTNRRPKIPPLPKIMPRG